MKKQLLFRVIHQQMQHFKLKNRETPRNTIKLYDKIQKYKWNIKQQKYVEAMNDKEICLIK